jgi:hypothetical protein
MHHNNPGKIGLWEVPNVWPSKSKYPDLMLSIGTGYAQDRLSLSRPKTPGLLARLVDAWDWHLCGNRQWKEILNFVPKDEAGRFFRFDLKLDCQEPQIDDFEAMDDLCHKTQVMLCMEKLMCDKFHHRWLASFFYVEIQCREKEFDCYHYKASFYMRQRLSKPGLRSLRQKLKESYFLVNGRVVSCFKDSQLNLYNRPFDFRVDDNEQVLNVTLAIDGERLPVSGLPRPVGELWSEQGLDLVFGRADHHRLQQPFSVPQRKLSLRSRME